MVLFRLDATASILRRKTQRAEFGTQSCYSQSEHSHRLRHGATIAACVGIGSIIDVLLKQRQGYEPIRRSSHVSNVNNDIIMMSAVNGMSALRAQRVDALSVHILLNSAKL